ncbi:MAG: hypothetical protein ACLFS2_10490 [Halochromatium sp.]|uniref:hypothetical protein n=1 Tax=Halochromatium sp. TaxID=2049430 RepID=UPI00397924E4
MYLDLSVDAQQLRAIRQVHARADDIALLDDQVRIGRRLERLQAMGLEPRGAPDPARGMALSRTSRVIRVVDPCVALSGMECSVVSMTTLTLSSWVAGGPRFAGLP